MKKFRMIEITFEVETLTVSRRGISLERERCSSDLEEKLSKPRELRNVWAIEPIGPEIESMTSVFTDNFNTKTSTFRTAAAGTVYAVTLSDLKIKKKKGVQSV